MVRSLILAAVAAIALAPHANAQVVLARSAVATGGGVSTGGSFRSVTTLGQAVIGTSDGASADACHGFWCGGALATVDVPEGPVAGPALPDRLEFGLPAPNPTRGGTRFELALPALASTRLTIVDVAGRHVARVLDARLAAGRHRLAWSGRADDGTARRAGIYYARLEVDGRPAGRRSVILLP